MFEKDIDLYDFDDDDFDTIMAKDISFKGTIRFTEPFMIRGTVSGVIEAKSDLVIDSGASARSEITTDRVLVRGTVEGNVTAARLIAIAAEGSVTGNIASAQVAIEPGASFNGNCTMAPIPG